MPKRQILSSNSETIRPLGKQKPENNLGRADIVESLHNIEGFDEPVKKLTRRQRRRLAKLAKKPVNKKRRFLKWFFVILLISLLSAGGFLAYKFIAAGNSIIQGNFLDILKTQKLKQDENGRSNFLILGTSEDDPNHGGSDLTDSMLVVSINQTDKNIYMFSVPRDLYVDYDMACAAGYSGKINGYFSCTNSGDTAADEQDRLAKTQAFVGDIFDMNIQYGIHVNHTVIKEVVDAIGGVDVDVQGSNGDPGILDRNFDWRCNYKCYLVKYDNGIHHLDGEHALFLSMARGDIAPTYGLGNSNFDREKNQQKILIAIRNKALSAGTLTNIGSVTKLIDALGNNLRTNIQTAEIRTIMQVANDVKSTDIHTISLVADDNKVMSTGNYNGASVVMPAAGIYEYSEIQEYIKKNISSDPVVREAAPIVVLNGTGQSGFGQTNADELTAKGYNVVLVSNAPDGTYGKVEIYQIGSDNPETAKKLAKTYGVTIKTTTPPVAVNGNVRFVIIFGSTGN